MDIKFIFFSFADGIQLLFKFSLYFRFLEMCLMIVFMHKLQEWARI